MRTQNLALVLIMLSVACIPKDQGIVIAGSTSVQPFLEKLADIYIAQHPGITINVQGGGSTAGIQAVVNKTCMIGTSSRNLKASEKGLNAYPMCYDGISLIVHRVNPVRNLTLAQIRDIFTGRITNWQDLGGENMEIIMVTREEGSGTRGAFEEMIMRKEAISDACLVQDSNGAVREIIALTPQGIGYISAGLVDDRIKALSIDGIYPSFENIACGDYELIRPFLLLTKGEPSGLTREFIDFILSAEAQKTLKSVGLIPIDDMKCEGK
ncbi:MAG TPA: phosphate ABC transporter substrate-binding protein [bacterium]